MTRFEIGKHIGEKIKVKVCRCGNKDLSATDGPNFPPTIQCNKCGATSCFPTVEEVLADWNKD
jgi:hypothetical protein